MTQKNPSVFHRPQKIPFGKNFRPQKIPRTHPSIKYVSGALGLEILFYILSKYKITCTTDVPGTRTLKNSIFLSKLYTGQSIVWIVNMQTINQGSNWKRWAEKPWNSRGGSALRNPTCYLLIGRVCVLCVCVWRGGGGGVSEVHILQIYTQKFPSQRSH